jgi:hypothetical protein
MDIRRVFEYISKTLKYLKVACRKWIRYWILDTGCVGVGFGLGCDFKLLQIIVV